MSGPPRKKTRRTAAARREQLLDVTTRLVAERRFHAISIEAVAPEAGITRATVYNHFADLNELLDAVIQRETSRALAQVSETALTDLDEGDPGADVRSPRAYLHAVNNQPSTWRLILMPPEGAPETLHQSIAKGRHTVLARLTRAVRPAMALGRITGRRTDRATAVGGIGRVCPPASDRSRPLPTRAAAPACAVVAKPRRTRAQIVHVTCPSGSSQGVASKRSTTARTVIGVRWRGTSW